MALDKDMGKVKEHLLNGVRKCIWDVNSVTQWQRAIKHKTEPCEFENMRELVGLVRHVPPWQPEGHVAAQRKEFHQDP